MSARIDGERAGKIRGLVAGARFVAPDYPEAARAILGEMLRRYPDAATMPEVRELFGRLAG